MTRLARFGWTLLLAALFVASGVYGYFVHRNHWPPYSLTLSAMKSLSVEQPARRIPGRWRREQLGDEELEFIDRLRALGYVGGVERGPSGKGVVFHAEDIAGRGWNLYTAGHAPEAYLMDMDGEVRHTWRFSFPEAFPDEPQWNLLEQAHFWRYVHLYPNGDLLAIFTSLGMLKVDRESRLLWAHRNNAHHEAIMGEAGEIYVLRGEERVIEAVDATRPVYDDQVAVLSPDGRMLRSVSITQALLDSPYDGLVAKMKSNVAEYDGDILHTNDLDFVSPEAFGLQGTSDSLVLVSMRYLSAILVVDLEQEKVVWAFSGLFHRQHDPTLLEPGRFLIFDNGTHGTWSRAIEFDVASQRVEWQFPRVRSKELYSDCCGGAQRLPNGNTLINFSGMGRALEVTPDGEVAWEFRSPHRSGESEEYIAQLMNLQRLPVEQAAWIQP